MRTIWLATAVVGGIAVGACGNGKGSSQSQSSGGTDSGSTDTGGSDTGGNSGGTDTGGGTSGGDTSGGGTSGGDTSGGGTSGGDTSGGGGGDSGAVTIDPSVEPAFTVTVGGEPSTCTVWEYPLPIEPEDGMHKPLGSVVQYQHNPPASGPNYEMWGAYWRYPAPPLAPDPLARPHWVHNLRHGAIVLVYRPDAPADVVDALGTAFEQIPTPGPRGNPDCSHMGIMTPDPELPNTYAVLAWGWMMTSNCTPKPADILDFAARHIFEAPEKECYDGAFPVRPPCYRFEDVPVSDWTREVPEGSPVTYNHNPPTSGPFYANTLKYGRYDVVVPEPYWTGILAKGGVVVLVRPDAPAELVADLQRQYDQLSNYRDCGNTMTAMVQDPNIENPWAFVANNQYMTGKTTACWSLAGFVYSRRGWGPFESCEDGTYVPPGPEPPAPTGP